MLTFVQVKFIGDTGAYASVGMKVLERAAGHATGAYNVPVTDVEATAVYTKLLEIDDPVTHPSPDPRDDFIGAVPFPGNDDVTHAAFVAERTIDFLQQQDGRSPFLCTAAFYSPHAPWVVPQRYLDRYELEQLAVYSE